MKKKHLLAVLGIVGIAGVGALLWCSRPRHQINRVSFDRIEKGMQQEEVEAIFGVPPGDYSDKLVQVHGAADFFWRNPGIGTTRSWVSNEGRVLVRFDDNGIVYAKRFDPPALVAKKMLFQTTFIVYDADGAVHERLTVFRQW